MKKHIIAAIALLTANSSFAVGGYSRITDYISANPTWTWSELAKMPNIKKWDNRTPKLEKKDNGVIYSIKGMIQGGLEFNAVGDKNTPLILKFVTNDISSDNNLTINQYLGNFFNKKELVQVKSNCTIQNGVREQKFFKWQRNGLQPMYIFINQSYNNGGTITDIEIAHSFNDFLKPSYITELYNYDTNNNPITCTFN